MRAAAGLARGSVPSCTRADLALRFESSADPPRLGDAVATKIEERIDALENRLKQLRMRQQRIEARHRAIDSRRTRREDTRKKVLVGAIVLARVARGELAETELRAWLAAALTKPEDRALFGL